MYRIDAANLPKPVPFFGRLTGFTTESFLNRLNNLIAGRSQKLNRPLTQEEVEATAYYAAKGYAIASYSSPLGITAGAWRAWDTRAEYKFPFVKSSETFRADAFPHPRVSILTGARAIIAWHALRLAAYAGLSSSIAGILLMSYGTSVAVAGELSDIRSKGMWEEMQKAAMKPGPRNLPQQPQPRTAPKPSTPQFDDASPTGGMIWDEPVTTNSNGSMQSPQSSTPFPQRQRAPVQTRTESEDKPFDVFDDVSPTGGQGMSADTSAPQGSAWERLRRGERLAPIPTKTSANQNTSQSQWQRQQNETQREQKQGSTTGDSFTFSQSDEERSFAKVEAQKEFDAKIERERRGGDFSQGNGDQRRW
jgi:hypothetical protein